MRNNISAKYRLSLKFADIPVYWDQASVSVREDATALTITLRRDVPVQGEDAGVTQEQVTVTANPGKFKVDWFINTDWSYLYSRHYETS